MKNASRTERLSPTGHLRKRNMRKLFYEIERRWTRICMLTFSDRCHLFQGIDNGSEGQLSDGDNHELSIGKLVSSVASDGGDSENEDNLAIKAANGHALSVIVCHKSEYAVMLVNGETTPTSSWSRIIAGKLSPATTSQNVQVPEAASRISKWGTHCHYGKSSAPVCAPFSTQGFYMRLQIWPLPCLRMLRQKLLLSEWKIMCSQYRKTYS